MSQCSRVRARKSSPARSSLSLSALGIFASVFWSAPAQAHRHDFPFTYDWKQPSHGEKEIEAHTTYLKNDASFEEEVEFEYGISKRFSIAPYLVFEHGPGESLHYSGFQLETRYQPVPYKTNKILSGLYEEYAKPKGEPGALESRLVLSRYDERGGDISLNLVLINSFTQSPQFHKAYSLGYAQPLGNNKYDLRGGLEWIHDLAEGHLNAGPVLSLKTSDTTTLTGGYAFAMNRHNANQDEFRLIGEYEF